MRNEIRIRDKAIGINHPLFIIAEVGITCNYDMKVTKDLIDVVHDAGADAAKFILWFPEEVMSDHSVTYTYDTVYGLQSENMFEMLDKLRFTLEEWHEVKEYADKKGVVMFATVLSPTGIEYAEYIGLEAYKLCSWDYTYFTLWRQIAVKGKPMLIDTGAVNTLEVAKVMQLMKEAGNDQHVLLHCLHTSDHAKINMLSIPYLRSAFDTNAGYSSRDKTDETDIMAITLGAVVLEKRLTMSRRLPGHHHILGKEPVEFAEYVKLMRNVHKALGTFGLIPSDADLKERQKFFRHLVANQDIPIGTRLTDDMLEGKRPEQGISPEYVDFFVGRTTKRPLRYNEALKWGDV